MRDLIIIGAGPAGLAAGIYGKRAGLDTLVIDETGIGGGQVVSTYEIDNYPGLPGISGMELGDALKNHAVGCGVEFADASVMGISKKESAFFVETSEGLMEAKAVIAATGATHKHLMIPGEDELQGMGVSYCATCDGAFFKNRVTAVVGGGDVALEDALFLARGCSKVYLIHRRNEFRGAKVLADKVLATENIEIIYDSKVTKVSGEDMVESITVENVKTAEVSEIAVSGLFIAVGMQPTTDIFEGFVDMDNGYIVAKEDGITSVEGFFVAGDVRTKALRQIITAAADGANAATSAAAYLT